MTKPLSLLLFCALASCANLKPSQYGAVAIDKKVKFPPQLIWPEARSTFAADMGKVVALCTVVAVAGVVVGPAVTAAPAVVPTITQTQSSAKPGQIIKPELVELDRAARIWFEDELLKAVAAEIPDQKGVTLVSAEKATSFIEIEVRYWGLFTDQKLKGNYPMATASLNVTIKDRGGKKLWSHINSVPMLHPIIGGGHLGEVITPDKLKTVPALEQTFRKLARDVVKNNFRFFHRAWGKE
jgi:hypothetical protein